MPTWYFYHKPHNGNARKIIFLGPRVLVKNALGIIISDNGPQFTSETNINKYKTEIINKNYNIIMSNYNIIIV